MCRDGLRPIAKAELQQNRSGPHRSHHHHSHRAEECSPVGEGYNQGQHATEQARGDDGPAAVLGLNVGQEFRPQPLYKGQGEGCQCLNLLQLNVGAGVLARASLS